MARNFSMDDLLDTPWVGANNRDKLHGEELPADAPVGEGATARDGASRVPAGANLQPEQRLQCEIVRSLRKVVAPMGGLVLALNGELPGGRGGKEHRFMRAQMVRKAMGYLPGTPDLLLACPPMFHRGLWPYGFMEIKVPGGDARISVRSGKLVKTKTAAGRLSESQQMFRDWCLKCGMPWACVHSADEAVAALAGWKWVEAS